ncbi:MAG: hypothetical protein J6M10_05715 [Clostridia bacterium]|nr:hypothetical protein [Clostridia bacterium]
MSKYDPIDLDAMDEQDMAQEKAQEKPAAKAVEPAFSRDQLLASVRYSNRRDALSVVLKPGRLYTDAEVEAELKKYYGKVVK